MKEPRGSSEERYYALLVHRLLSSIGRCPHIRAPPDPLAVSIQRPFYLPSHKRDQRASASTDSFLPMPWPSSPKEKLPSIESNSQANVPREGKGGKPTTFFADQSLWSRTSRCASRHHKHQRELSRKDHNSPPSLSLGSKLICTPRAPDPLLLDGAFPGGRVIPPGNDDLALHW